MDPLVSRLSKEKDDFKNLTQHEKVPESLKTALFKCIKEADFDLATKEYYAFVTYIAELPLPINQLETEASDDNTITNKDVKFRCELSELAIQAGWKLAERSDGIDLTELLNRIVKEVELCVQFNVRCIEIYLDEGALESAKICYQYVNTMINVFKAKASRYKQNISHHLDKLFFRANAVCANHYASLGFNEQANDYITISKNVLSNLSVETQDEGIIFLNLLKMMMSPSKNGYLFTDVSSNAKQSQRVSERDILDGYFNQQLNEARRQIDRCHAKSNEKAIKQLQKVVETLNSINTSSDKQKAAVQQLHNRAKLLIKKKFENKTTKQLSKPPKDIINTNASDESKASEVVRISEAVGKLSSRSFSEETSKPESSGGGLPEAAVINKAWLLFSEQAAKKQGLPACDSVIKFQVVNAWLCKVLRAHGCQGYLFGSAIYKQNPADLDILLLNNRAADSFITQLRDKNIIVARYQKEGRTIIKAKVEDVDIDVSFFDGDLERHCQKVDFTINAIYLDLLSGQIYSPNVHAKKDLCQGVIRAIAPAKVMYKEHPERILRAIKIQASTGFVLHASDESVISALFKEKNLFLEVNKDRLYLDFVKLFFQGHGYASFLALKETGLFTHLFPYFNGLSDAEQRITNYLVEQVLYSVDAGCGKVTYPPSLLYYAINWLSFGREHSQVKEAPFINLQKGEFPALNPVVDLANREFIRNLIFIYYTRVSPYTGCRAGFWKQAGSSRGSPVSPRFEGPHFQA